MLNFDETLRTELPHARYLVLELAALLDRLDYSAAQQSVTADQQPQLKRLRAAIAILAESSVDRTERILRADSEK